MARKKRITIEDQLAALRKAADKAEADHSALPELVAAVEFALGDPSNLLVDYAAKLIVEHDLAVPAKMLFDAFRRFCDDPTDTDKGCRAKNAIVEAMLHLDIDDPDFFMQGMKYVQHEPTWTGSPEDSAAHLRGLCAHALIRSHTASPATTMLALVDLLNDPERHSRAHAARAIALMHSPASVPLLRMKVLIGDSDSEVLGECFRGMLETPKEESIDFVASYLEDEPDVAIEAATALGESHHEAAVRALIAAATTCPSDLIEAFFVSLGLSRHPSAIEFLLNRIRNNSGYACHAVKALAPIRFYPDVTEKVAEAVRIADDHQVTESFRSCFDQ